MPSRKAALAIALLAVGPALAADTAVFETCKATWDGAHLTLANSHVERRWTWSNNRLLPISFRDLATGFEWLAKSTPVPGPVALKFTSHTGPATPVQAPSLSIDLESPTAAYHFQLFPAARGILLQTTDPDALSLASEHLRLTQVTLADQTDNHNQLVFERDWLPTRNEGALQLEGNLFVTEDTVTHAGLIFLKLGPLPHARPEKSPWDLEAATKGRTLQCTFSSDYPTVVLAYTGGRAGRTEALQTFQRQLRPFVPGRDGMFLSNTWGDRSRDLRINAAFMRHEIEAGSELGVDVIQIDDGWQTGRTANSARGSGVWNGFWADNPNFWQPDPTRFPGGLQPLAQEAAAKGLKFGLWYAPDSSNSFANWQRDAARLLELHRDGIDYFKIDGVKAITKEGERNLRRLFDRVQQETHGSVVFDLDVTAETRPGYFGVPDVGPLFVENRYTDFHGYWPHQTLRNLWQLAGWVDPRRLRMEVLNNQRNQKLYDGDPLAPARYTPDYLFASVMFANPLGWFEISNLPPDYRTTMAKLVATWKQHRNNLFNCTILPIGQPPDGGSWSGFAAFNPSRTAGYILFFRGIGAPPEWKEPLSVFGPNAQVKPLAGAGKVILNAAELTVQIPQSPGYVWVQVEDPK